MVVLLVILLVPIVVKSETYPPLSLIDDPDLVPPIIPEADIDIEQMCENWDVNQMPYYPNSELIQFRPGIDYPEDNPHLETYENGKYCSIYLNFDDSYEYVRDWYMNNVKDGWVLLGFEEDFHEDIVNEQGFLIYYKTATLVFKKCHPNGFLRAIVYIHDELDNKDYYLNAPENVRNAFTRISLYNYPNNYTMMIISKGIVDWDNICRIESQDRISILLTQLQPDPLISFSLRGRDPELNAIDDPVVSPYDDLICRGELLTSKIEDPDNINWYFALTTSSGLQQGVEKQFSIKQLKSGARDELRFVQGGTLHSLGDNVYCGVNEGDSYNNVTCLFYIPYNLLERGDEVNCVVEVKTNDEVLSERADPRYVAKHLYVYIPFDYDLSKEEFKEDVLREHVLYQDLSGLGQYAKAIIRYDKSCQDKNTLRQCVRTVLKEQLDPTRDIIMAADTSFAGLNNDDVIFVGLSKEAYATVAHEIGHSYGLCDEYVYGTKLKIPDNNWKDIGEWISYGGWKLQDMLEGCRNPYPKCCNDHPEHDGSGNNCYNINHCQFDVGLGPVFTDDDKLYGCFGDYYGDNTWSVMGSVTNPNTRACISPPINIRYPAPVPEGLIEV
jgi:hypothetical protein